MKVAKLFHNPGAGDKGSTQKDLISMVRSAGFDCSYSSIKKENWKKFEAEGVDFIIVAGGDGTVRKVVTELLDKKLPIALLPLGTANNIANSLGISGTREKIIQTWTDKNLIKFDVGVIYGVSKAHYFVEGLGYGVFPALMQEMKGQKKESKGSPGKKIARSLEVLYEIILTYPARFCNLQLDGINYSGKFLLAEVMNTPSIGPNLYLAPFASPGDGNLEVALITEEQRDEFAAYVLSKIRGKEEPHFFHTLKAKNVIIHWEAPTLHIDDELIRMEKDRNIKIELLEGMLSFFGPEKKAEVLSSAFRV